MNLAKEKNLVTLEEEETACCYAVQDKFWVSDPDNIKWEVYYFHKDVDLNDPKYDKEKSTSCCVEEIKAESYFACNNERTPCC